MTSWGDIFFMFLLLLVILILVFSGIDIHFDTSHTLNLKSALGLNAIFTLSSIILMVLMLILSFSSSVFHSDTKNTAFALVLSAIGIYIVKAYLIGKYGILFSIPSLIIFGELALFMIVPFIAYLVLSQYGKAFKN